MVVRQIYKKGLHLFNSLYPSTNIFSKNWELCIILDACRYDLLIEVADEFDFLKSVDSLNSVDSMTKHWIKKTFIKSYSEEIESTVYITGNPFARNIDTPEPDDIVHVWKWGWDDDVGTVLPETITDETIYYFRNNDVDRAIVHYMQPHIPFLKYDISDPKKPNNFGGDGCVGRNVWDELRDGLLEEEKIWSAYQNNLRVVLNDLEVLLENVDANRAVITSDHGNAFGEWGLYGHPMHMPIPALRKVPWVETVAKDENIYSPDINKRRTRSTDVNEQLKRLGYR